MSTTPDPKTTAASPEAEVAAAIRRAEERVARDPGTVAFAQLADLYRKAGRTADTVRVCREGLTRFPQYTTARLILAKALAAEGAPDAALAETDLILTANPKDAPARRLAAEIERGRGRVDAAATHLEVVVAADHRDRESRALLALLRADPAADGASALTRVLRDDVFVTPSFGAVCLEQGAAEEAALVFTRILRQNPTHAGARDGLEQALRARLRRKG
jgi:tetratricopeptide (TPR) repeat protein